MFNRYPFPWKMAGLLTLAILHQERRSFRMDAAIAVHALQPPLRVIGEAHIPGPCVITINHYTRPGFQAWWLALGVSATLPVEVHWVVTSAWRYADRLRSRTITPISAWILKQASEVYGFTRMPPMPPRPEEAVGRAQAVREIIYFARQADFPVIGLAPEGGDFSTPGKVAELPTGLGRLMIHLGLIGLDVLPVGAYEANGQFCLNFGQAYHLEPPSMNSTRERDAWARQIVRQKIEDLLI